MTRSVERLELLVYGHFLAAGYADMLAVVPIVLRFVADGTATPGGPVGADGFLGLVASRISWPLAWALLVVGILSSTLFALAGLALRQRRHLSLVRAVAQVELLFAPIGTVVGLATLQGLAYLESEQHSGPGQIFPS